MAKKKSVTKKKVRRVRVRRRNPRWRWWALGLLGTILFVGLIVLARGGGRPASAVGEDVPLEGSEHIPVNTPPQYRRLPPSSGQHYGSTLRPGFYEETVLTQVQYPEGYLVHNLEHGYVIFWYDCSQLSEEACQELKEMIKGVMRPGLKLIAYPYPGLDVPLVLTSWGKELRLADPKPEDLEAFIAANYNRAPEPGAP